MSARFVRIVLCLVIVSVGACWANIGRAALITSFQGAFQSSPPATGWSYLWNSAGPIGTPANYTALLPTPTGRYSTDGTDNLPAAAPGAYAGFGFQGAQLLPGGHPGFGATQSGSLGIERYVIAEFTVASPDTISILNGLVRNINPNNGGSTDGLNLKVFLNDNASPVTTAATAPGVGSQTTFAAALGNLNAGDRIYVAVGSKNSDLFDSFALEYDITSVPEPGNLWLIVVASLMAILTGSRLRRSNIARCAIA